MDSQTAVVPIHHRQDGELVRRVIQQDQSLVQVLKFDPATGDMLVNPMLQAIFRNPNETQHFAGRLARLFHDKEVDMVVGLGRSATLAHCVAGVIQSFYADPPRQVTSLSLEYERPWESAGLKFSDGEEDLRGKRVLLVEPVLTLGRWEDAQRCIDFIENEVNAAATVFAVGVIFQQGNIPLAPKNVARIESLMQFSSRH